jgi:hypothetical protein
MNNQTDKTKQFLAEVVEVCRKHGLSIAHEDEHGAFVVKPYSEGYAEWLLDAVEDTKP